MSFLDFINRLPTSNELYGGFGELLGEIHSKIFTDTLVLRDILIEGENGYTSQIDLILIGTKGLYVVEMKMYPDAKIYGDGKKTNWYYYKAGKKYEIYSPLMQNRKHIRYLKSMLSEKFGELPYFSILTIVCDDFNVQNINTDGVIDTGIASSLPAMKKVMGLLADGKPDVLDEGMQHRIFDYIKANQIKGNEARYQHKHEVADYQRQLREKQDTLICPKCGGKLVLRSSKYGEFFGCSNYPKCRYVRKSSPQKKTD